ncbi:MAG: PDZ domain-containing protein [Acidobacteriota bacterium]|nr:PDZ domain-containing protein [Acidobacteriota bacterium]MDH3529814.1 PDZ domain-containing protein [Acidobacteriota bacterium]
MPVAPEIRVLPDGLKIDDARAYSFFSGRYLGVGVVSLTKQLGDYFGVEGGKGLLINDVTKDSPAERAGLRAGDVIVEIDGKEVKNHSDLFRGMRGDNEEPVVLTVVRDRARQTISVTPDKRPGATLQLKRNESITRDDSN